MNRINFYSFSMRNLGDSLLAFIKSGGCSDSIYDSNTRNLLDSLHEALFNDIKFKDIKLLNAEEHLYLLDSILTNGTKVKRKEGDTVSGLFLIIDSCSLSYLDSTTLGQVTQLINNKPNVSIGKMMGNKGSVVTLLKFGPDIVYGDDTIPNIYFTELHYIIKDDSKCTSSGGFIWNYILRMNSDSTFNIIEKKCCEYFQ